MKEYSYKLPVEKSFEKNTSNHIDIFINNTIHTASILATFNQTLSSFV